MKVKKDKIEKVCILNQSNKDAKYNSRVTSSRQNLNAVVEIYHEGKTLGSVLCGPTPGCSTFNSTQRKILVDALGTLRTTGT
jgi:hypothetical protein